MIIYADDADNVPDTYKEEGIKEWVGTNLGLDDRLNLGLRFKIKNIFFDIGAAYIYRCYDLAMFNPGHPIYLYTFGDDYPYKGFSYGLIFNIGYLGKF